MALKIPKRTRYRKRIGVFGALDTKHDESVLDFSTAVDCYNFDAATGALKDGYGLESLAMVPSGARRFWQHRYYSETDKKYVDQFVYQHYNGLLRYYDEVKGRYFTLSSFSYPFFDALPYRLGSKDVLLLSCEGRSLMTWDGRLLVEHTDSPIISSMALHYERLFVTSREQPTKVFFSDDLDPTNWQVSSNGGGFIELLDERGYLTKVVSFANYLYIFREHGISRVTAFGDQREFSVTHMYVTTGRIYPESIVKCGAVIMFSASDGVYMFDGYECRKVLSELDGLLGEAAASAYFDGKYFLSCKIDFGDGKTVGCESGEHTANALLVYNISTGIVGISRGLDIVFMNPVTIDGVDRLVGCDASGGGIVTECGAKFGVPLPKHWQSPYSDFGMPDRLKSLRDVYTDGATAFTLSVVADGRTTAYAVPSGPRRIRSNASARRISVAIDTENVGCEIKPPTLVYSV